MADCICPASLEGNVETVLGPLIHQNQDICHSFCALSLEILYANSFMQTINCSFVISVFQKTMN